MTTINFSNPRNIVTLCEQILNPDFANEIIQKGKAEGLSNEEQLQTWLDEGNYESVLKAVWSERDRERRHTWLAAKENQLHAPLMYELAIASFIHSPTAQTVSEVCIPLLKAAGVRVCQDAQCSKDRSVSNGDHVVRLQMAYVNRLTEQTKKILNLTVVEIVEGTDKEIRIAAIKQKVNSVAELSMQTKLPDPEWIAWHGMGAFMGGIKMHPVENYKAITDAFAQKIINS